MPTNTTVAGGVACPRPALLQALLDESLNSGDRGLLGAHVGNCARCQGALAALEAAAGGVAWASLPAGGGPPTAPRNDARHPPLAVARAARRHPPGGAGLRHAGGDRQRRHGPGKSAEPNTLPLLIRRRLRHFEEQCDAAGCRATAELFEKLNRPDADQLYLAARLRAVAAEVATHAGSPADATADADRAMAWLTKAVAAGHGGRADFQALLKAKSKPQGP